MSFSEKAHTVIFRRIWKHAQCQYFVYNKLINIVSGKRRNKLKDYNSRYLDFGYLELPLISKRKSGPCFNTEI